MQNFMRLPLKVDQCTASYYIDRIEDMIKQEMREIEIAKNNTPYNLMYQPFAYKVEIPSSEMIIDEFLEYFGKDSKDMNLKIKKVIFSNRDTIILWEDGDKTRVRCQEDEPFDKEKGFAMAVCKKVFGTNNSKSNFNEEIKKWIH